MENYEKKYKSALEWMRSIYPTMQGADKEDAEHYFPELRESKDERIRKGLVKGLSAMRDIHHHQTFSDDAINIDDAIAWLEKQGEQKFIDKIEPKFNVGDWITNGEYIWKVTDIKPLDYILQSPNGDVVDDTISYVDENLYLWTIQDAKDGDVLADEKPFIFRGFGDREHPNNPTAYCGITTSGNFILSTENEWWTADDFYPATKEQRDILFQRMKEAGYEWDAEKKELKKIEQKLFWSEEDERILNKIQDHIREFYVDKKGYPYVAEPDSPEMIENNWLQSLKDRVQSKQEWSKEDEKILKRIDSLLYSLCQIHGSEYEQLHNWLKSLKPRWKPSEEQMEALKKRTHGLHTSSETRKALESLIDDLTKL